MRDSVQHAKKVVASVVAAAMLFVAAFAGWASAETKTKYPLKLKDALNRTVTLKKAPSRIISLSPGVTEILFALGLGPKVVGVTSYCDYPAEAKKKEKIGTFSEPSVEKIIAMQPDLIIGAAGISLPILKQLDDLGFVTMVSDAKTVADVKATIMDIAEAADSIDKGTALVASMNRRIDKVTGAVKTVKDRPKVFYELWGDPLMSAGPNTFVDDLITLAGGVNVAKDAKVEWPMYSLEVLVKDNPDVILYAHVGETPAQIRARKGWETIKAVKNNRVVKLSDENTVLRPGPRIVEALEEIAAAIHPGMFK